MSQQRMAGSNQFQKDMNAASTGAGGQFHKTKEPGLVGDNAWDAQVEREGDQMNNPAVIGSYGGKNIKDFADISKQPTQENGSFSIDTSNKYVNNARSQSLINKQNNSGFSANRVTNNVNYATVQGNNTYGDMYAYARKELPGWKQGEAMKGQEMPDFNKMYNQTKNDLNDYKI